MNVCYCGHPKERHTMKTGGLCLHCCCSEYAEQAENGHTTLHTTGKPHDNCQVEKEQTSEENIVGDYWFKVEKAETGYVITGGYTTLDLQLGGKIISQGKDANEVFSMAADAFLTGLDIPAKPQEEPKCCEKCSKCPDYGDGHKEYCHDADCPCHKQEEPKSNQPSK
jgi:hypothetical protein